MRDQCGGAPSQNCWFAMLHAGIGQQLSAANIAQASERARRGLGEVVWGA